MKKILSTAAMVIGLMFASPGFAAQFDVTITNLTNASAFTPLLVAAHPPATHVFQLATTASANLQAMAEGGDIAGLVIDLGVAADVVQDPAGGVLMPGVSATAMFNTAAANTHLSIVAMILPTNDGFTGIDALAIPTAAGTYTYHLNAYDAGTEVNNELVIGMAGGAPGVLGIPADPGGNAGTGGTGVTTVENNTTIHIHRNVLGDTNAAGGTSDLDSTIHRWLNPVARITITVQ